MPFKPASLLGHVSGDPGEDPLDPWSVVHAASGLALGLFVRNGMLALALLLAYEGAEALLRRIPVGGRRDGLFEYESWRNIGFDILFGMIGWLFAQGMPAIPLPWDVPWLPGL